MLIKTHEFSIFHAAGHKLLNGLKMQCYRALLAVSYREECSNKSSRENTNVIWQYRRGFSSLAMSCRWRQPPDQDSPLWLRTERVRLWNSHFYEVQQLFRRASSKGSLWNGSNHEFWLLQMILYLPGKKNRILLIYFKWLGTYLSSWVCVWEEEAREENVMQNFINKSSNMYDFMCTALRNYCSLFKACS